MMDEIAELIDLCGIYAQVAGGDTEGRRNDSSGTFWLIYNRLLVTQEILGFYITAWSSEKMPDPDEGYSDELTDRMMTVTKNLFVDVMSIIERGTKIALGPHEESLFANMERRRYLYLRDIMRASTDKAVISRSALQEWEDLLSVRNLVVHNNSVADRSYRLVLGDLKISMRPDRMMKGPMVTFISLSGRAITLYNHWLSSFDGKCRRSQSSEA